MTFCGLVVLTPWFLVADSLGMSALVSFSVLIEFSHVLRQWAPCWSLGALCLWCSDQFPVDHVCRPDPRLLCFQLDWMWIPVDASGIETCSLDSPPCCCVLTPRCLHLSRRLSFTPRIVRNQNMAGDGNG